MYIVFLVFGIGIGVVFGLNKARASSPEGEISGGEQPASVYYDESWQATEAYVSTSLGYKPMPTTDIVNHRDTDVAANLTTGQVVFPKMVVTQWTVHGHIHFE